MKRRICLTGAALSVALLVLGSAVALAASSGKALHSTCRTDISVLPPAGQSNVLTPPTNGSEYGTARCSKLGKGAQGDTFNVPDSGNTFTRFVWYLSTGTIRGRYELIPQSASSLDFTAVNYLGTLKVTGGTGTFARAKGTGTMTCASPDTVHTSCVDHIKLIRK